MSRRGEIVVRHGRDGKDHRTTLPLRDALLAQMEQTRLGHA
ncbi:hypothetical protein [Xanthomonas translucens]|nr:hypothetical protein [Xanthomonas translucens]MCS3360914.1 hypothetical protein [Xanthomonas translucens pv. translucens]MCT8275802.1 hypothetical protein [Xanthomonas translucens pv. translucens]MCT8283569.1 hypothetical protein [Xanthomonas translucens pv. undulosa]MCT8290507.1 hypothetical protein [Xanthomonas translucens pv. translucens]MCT8294197.1 hypothetical protein [Xanthomonas translucens pv. translucens]